MRAIRPQNRELGARSNVYSQYSFWLSKNIGYLRTLPVIHPDVEVSGAATLYLWISWGQ